MTTITLDVKLVLEECCNCGMAWAMPERFQRKMRETRQTFYCPAGHAQQYVGETDAERANKDAEKYKRLWQDERRYAAAVVAERNTARRELKTTRAQLTKTKKRVQNGVCPCCNRHFVNLERHMHGQHPGYDKSST